MLAIGDKADAHASGAAKIDHALDGRGRPCFTGNRRGQVGVRRATCDEQASLVTGQHGEIRLHLGTRERFAIEQRGGNRIAGFEHARLVFEQFLQHEPHPFLMQGGELGIGLVHGGAPFIVSTTDALTSACLNFFQALRERLVQHADGKEWPGLFDQVQPINVLGGAH